jgi:GTPase SAR1 family protein
MKKLAGKDVQIPNDRLTSLDLVISESKMRDMNEAATRHRIIDFILHDFFSWPKNRVVVEEYIAPGFADYVLQRVDGHDLLFIEAKREGHFFELPIPYRSDETSCFIEIKKLISDPNIKAAMVQVRSYCLETGCEYACITNGHEWIFFKIFEKGKRWENLKAFVVRNLEYFSKEYTRAINSFSFTAIIENASLPSLLTSAHPQDRSIFYPKEKIPAYSHTITANRLAPMLRPIVNHYFGVIEDDDAEFMDRCYVSHREYIHAQSGMHNMIQDSLSPYFIDYGVTQLDDTGKGGQLGGRFTKNLKRGRKGEVIVLFGGKGAGKSTFIKRLLHHNPPRWLKDHALISIVDLLKIPEDVEVIRKTIWDRLVERLDIDKVLSGDRGQLLSTLFDDRYQIAKKQDLAGLAIGSESYNLRVNLLLSEWKKDKVYVAERLVSYWADRNKGIIVVVDNTDQYSSVIQDFCFTSAQEISTKLKCITLISMREERFYDSKIHGVLDAFQNAGFHISSPKPAEVFRKRLEYTVGLLTNKRKRDRFIGDIDDNFVIESSLYLNILKSEFSSERSPLNNFLTACAHGDTRLSLDLFRSFLLSGYTNVDEMLTAGEWTFQIHQVIKPVMIPTRYFYEETVSDIPNIFQIRSARQGSHFTALRILRKLGQGINVSSSSYYSVAELRAYFAETFNMASDFQANVDILLKHGFVEANNRLDSYSESVDRIKITNYGFYMLNQLAFDFTYVDLVCTDCGLYNEQTSNYLAEAAKKEYKLFLRRERVERVKVRIERVEEFVKYLVEEEYRERELYTLGMPESEMFSYKAKRTFEAAKHRVLKSAQRQDVRG